MSDRIQVLTGHAAHVQRLVDGDLAATLVGPAAINRRLAERDVITVEACYRALLDRAWQERAAGARQAALRAAAADAATERAATARGGGR